jgi:hypothetical protein
MHLAVVIYYEGLFLHHVNMILRDPHYHICHNVGGKEISYSQEGMLESDYMELYEHTLVKENHIEHTQKNILF